MRAAARVLAVALGVLGLSRAVPTTATEQRPDWLPKRDVAVTYRVSGRTLGDIRQMHVRFAAATQRMRVETEDRAMGYLLVDPRARTAKMVVPGIGQYVDLPLARDRRAAMLFNDRLRFTRRGTSRVAGIGCTLWDVRGPESGRAKGSADSARACITADGVILRAEGTGGDVAGSMLEATRVDYTPQRATLFELPAGTGQLRVQDLIRQSARPQ